MALEIISRRDATAADQALVGGKAYGLSRLLSLGATVPEWFVVATHGFSEHLHTNGLAAQAQSEMERLSGMDPTSQSGREAIEAASARIRALILETRLSGALAAAVERAVAELGVGPFAVRSSMVGEDSAEQSFAGQFDTLLFQQNSDEVKSAIVSCWASAFSARSLAYRIRAKSLKVDAAMAVVVQRMVDGHVSGVAFTANPLNGRRDEAVVTACYGLGEGIVGGACNTDEFVLTSDGRERLATIADKDLMVVRHPSGRGTHEVEVAEVDRKRRCIDEATVSRLVADLRKLADKLGGPYDFEWTVDRGVIYLLQARPVTTLSDRRGPRIVWDNSNIQESYCGVTTPLTFSFALRAYASVYEQTARFIGVPDDVIGEYRPVFRNLLGLIRGRVYYNINNWYRGLLLLPSFGRNKSDMEKMMGLEEPVDFVEGQSLTGMEKLRRAPQMAAVAGRFAREFSRIESLVDEFMAQFDKNLASIERSKLGTKSISELVELNDWVRREILGRWHTPILNDFYVMMASGDLRRAIKDVDEDTAPLWNALVAGEEGIESTEPTRALMRLAEEARRSPRLAEILTTLAPAAAIAAMREEFPAAAASFDRYIERYGDRAMGELKLETVSLREDPSFLFRVLGNYIATKDLEVESIAQKEREQRRAAEDRVRSKVGPFARIRFERALKATRRGVKARENMRLARTRAFGLSRDIYRAIGAHLAAAGQLDEPRDVFYLTVEEIEAYHDGTAVTSDLAALARIRRAEFARYEAMDLPNHFETVGPVYHGNDFDEAPTVAVSGDTRVLRGLACSKGRVEAPLCVIRDPRDDLHVNGRILTALRTDPGWAPLFPTASGVLVERGSSLSHSAVIARELGIPAVVGVPGLLSIVRDGERVCLDGSAGTVDRLDEVAKP